MAPHLSPRFRNEHNPLVGVFNRLPRGSRGHVVAVIGELVGTFFFLFFGFSGAQTVNLLSNPRVHHETHPVAVSKTPSQLLYISLSFAFSLAVNAWVYARVSGGLFNPAVTLGMVMIKKITILRGFFLVLAQIVAAVLAALVVKGLFGGKLDVSTTLSPDTSHAKGVLIELLLTTQLVFTIFMLAAEKHVGNFLAPVGIGLSLFVAHLSGVYWTGASLNPARSIAPSIALGKFNSEEWIYWVGPAAGTILAYLLHGLLRVLEYETANEDPDEAQLLAGEGNSGENESLL